MPQLPPKFEKLLNKNNYAIESIFTFKGICRYIRVISLETGDMIVLFIDPEFAFSPKEGTSVVELSLVEFVAESEGDAIEKFHDYPATKDVEGKYRVPMDIKIKEDKFEDQAENKYKHKIFLKDFEKPKILQIKACFRQLQRLS